VFAALDKFKRILVRYEKKVINLEGFHIIAFIQMLYDHTNK